LPVYSIPEPAVWLYSKHAHSTGSFPVAVRISMGFSETFLTDSYWPLFSIWNRASVDGLEVRGDRRSPRAGSEVLLAAS